MGDRKGGSSVEMLCDVHVERESHSLEREFRAKQPDV